MWLTNVVVRSEPFQRITEVETKPAPCASDKLCHERGGRLWHAVSFQIEESRGSAI